MDRTSGRAGNRTLGQSTDENEPQPPFGLHFSLPALQPLRGSPRGWSLGRNSGGRGLGSGAGRPGTSQNFLREPHDNLNSPAAES